LFLGPLVHAFGQHLPYALMVHLLTHHQIFNRSVGVILTEKYCVS
jgi:hypothetical protein